MTLGPIIDRQVERNRALWANPSLWHLAGPWAMVLFLTAVLVSVWNADLSSAKREAQAIATVVGVDSSNHDCYRYSLSINGRSYTNCGFPRDKLFKIGDPVITYYDPNDPSRNHLYSFKEEINNDVLLILMVWMFFAVMPTVFVLWRRHLYRSRVAMKPNHL